MTRLSTHIICDIYHVTGAYLKSEVFILFRHTPRKYHYGTIIQVHIPYFESITWLLWWSLYSSMLGARASSPAESGSIEEELGQRFMRLRSRQMPETIKCNFAVIVRIQFGSMVLRLESGLWRTVVWVPGVNRRTSPAALVIELNWWQTQSKISEIPYRSDYRDLPTQTATDIHKKTKNAEPSFFFYLPRFNPVSLSVKVCPYFYNLLFSIYFQCFQSILMFPIDNVSSRCSQFTYNFSNYEQPSRTIRYDLYMEN